MRIIKISGVLLLFCIAISAQAMKMNKKVKMEKARDRAKNAIEKLVGTITQADNALKELQEAKTDMLHSVFETIQEKTVDVMIPGLKNLSDKIVSFNGKAWVIPSIGSYELKFVAQPLGVINDREILRNELKILKGVERREKIVQKLIQGAVTALGKAESKLLKGEPNSSSYEILEGILKGVNADLDSMKAMKEQIIKRIKELK